MAKETAKKLTAKEIMAMTVTVKTLTGDKTLALVKFLPAVDYIDDTVKVDKDYKLPKVAGKDKDGNEVYRPVYKALQLWVTFKADKKNDTTTADKDTRKANNAKIMAEAKGFKAVCRDLTAMADKANGKGFLKLTASLPCPENISVNKATSGFWLFTSETLREDFLKMVQRGILDGKYVLASEEKPKKHSKTVEKIAKLMGISYEEAYQKWQSMKEA